MIYLLSQMLLCIVFALVAGGGIGWLLQRSRSNGAVQALQATVAQQRLQVEQARTDVSLVTQDFDELRLQTRDEIDELRQENRRIPSLLQNLDKSQTLVRQLMQKHEAQLRDLAHEKEALQARVSALSERESLWQATSEELDALRSQLSGSSPGSSDGSSGGEQVDGSDQDGVRLEHDADDDGAETERTTAPDADAAPVHDASAPVEDDAAPRSNWASARLSDIPPSIPTPQGDDESDSRALMRSMGLDFSPSDTDEDVDSMEDSGALAELEAGVSLDDDELDDSLLDEDTILFDDDADDQDADGDPDEVGPLFDTVDRHDDLKRIFGIGPVTEKALNQLGITSYSQLAELEHHEIETIALALQIFPSRIERDDWVGNARRQLEDVLEEL